MLNIICTFHFGNAVVSTEARVGHLLLQPLVLSCHWQDGKIVSCSLIYIYIHTHTHYIYIISGFLPFRTLFPVSNLFISQDPTLSYLHVHCKCNVNESSDKIFLYFVISKEFLYRRTQWSLAFTSSIVFWVVLQGGPGPLFFFFFSIQICYMSVRPFSKDFIQFGFLWLKKNTKLPVTPKAFDAPSILRRHP